MSRLSVFLLFSVVFFLLFPCFLCSSPVSSSSSSSLSSPVLEVDEVAAEHVEQQNIYAQPSSAHREEKIREVLKAERIEFNERISSSRSPLDYVTIGLAFLAIFLVFVAGGYYFVRHFRSSRPTLTAAQFKSITESLADQYRLDTNPSQTAKQSQVFPGAPLKLI
jgi:hypothetical protein